MSDPLLSPVDNEISSSSDADLINKVNKKELPALGKTRFNWLFIKRLFRILKILFPKLLSVTLGFFIFFLCVRAAAEYNYYSVGLVPSSFYTSLTQHDASAFKESLYQAVIVVFAAGVCKSAVDLVAYIIYVRWRSLITSHLHLQYFKNLNYYKLNVIETVVDNPDQRITQDVEKFCNDLGTQLIPKLALWPFVVGYYTYKTYVTMGYIGVLTIYGLFVVATVINKFLMGPVVSLIVEQERKEGDFRFHHALVRSNAESIAFYNGGVVESNKARQLLGRLLKTQLGLAHWTFPLNFSVNMFDYVSSIITYAVLGIIAFTANQMLTPGEISQLSFFSLYLLNNFSTLVDQSSKVADLAGYTHRIGHLLEVLDQLNKPSPSATDNSLTDNDSDMSNSDMFKSSMTEAGVITAAVFDDVTIVPPNGAAHGSLVEGLTFKFEKGKSILISGPSGSGKSSLLRVLKHLWPPLKGKAYICLDEGETEVMFVPQKPHLTMGTLADQLLKDTSDDDSCLDYLLRESSIDEVVTLAGLLPLKERLGGSNVVFDGNWNDYVSPGEMQKIAFARLFYHKPPFAVLDEATSSLSEEDEHYFYSVLHQMGTTVLSVGHRSTIKQYHQVLLSLSGHGGGWKLGPMY